MNTSCQLSDEAILHELGVNITRERLNKNLTQGEASLQAGISKRTLERLEAGDSIQLTSFLRVLRALNLLETFRTLLPEPTMSPMAQLQLKTKQRRRASRRRSKGTTIHEEPWTWKQ